MKRKFITPVSMRCRIDQYQSDIRRSLLSMGIEPWNGIDYVFESEHVLVTHFGKYNNKTGFVEEQFVRRDQYFIDHYNPELFLALAAMSDGDFRPGEWVICVKAGENDYVKVNELYEVSKVDASTIDIVAPKYSVKWSKLRFRKANKEELINHFTKQSDFQFGPENPNHPGFKSMLCEIEKPENQGIRLNSDKPQWSLVDFASLEDMVKVLQYGAGRYGKENWRKGFPTTQICESLLRHTFAYLSGEDNDQETGLPHFAHIQCNALFLAHTQRNKPELDTRETKQIEAA
ncbi:dATP/dGTP diphosphohydrolase domain-containing protein [Dyadobacter sandarakinus]|uniref:dATP/dGTP diphosphohydrolase N-terminal domain-containing protein n=1 Tax=Dyadobacter sandarakinus TaxID=2747268 RepID=A0ABX7I1H3_9BACT|nr:dATP/dGTP diphosphohydrolase domain-containing protein [Dyadobacter sandarakinus]QRQ99764.1 hypothetical protein HWI92_01930 [Dyadobacter sandarakinus]